MPDSHLVTPFLNKLYLMKIADIPYMNLAGEDLKPDRGHVFHITFPSEWKTSDIGEEFQSCLHIKRICFSPLVFTTRACVCLLAG